MMTLLILGLFYLPLVYGLWTEYDNERIRKEIEEELKELEDANL